MSLKYPLAVSITLTNSTGIVPNLWLPREKTLVLCEAYRHRSPVREAGPNGLPCSGMLKETGQKLPRKQPT